MPATLEAIEARFEAMRLAPPDPLAAFEEGVAAAPPWHAAARAVAAALAAAPCALPYHNCHHFAEATLAMGWLAEAARQDGLLDSTDLAVGALAMLGHDLDHDGSAATDGRLEAIAAARVAALAAASGLAAALCDRVADVILATNPALIARNATAAGTPAGLLRQLANEADAFASLLPRLGPRLGDLLAAERGAPLDRLAFLRAYTCFSPPAHALGLAAQHAAEVHKRTSAPPAEPNE